MSAEDAGQGAARAAGRRSRAPRLGPHDQGGRPGDCGHQQGPRRRDPARRVPRGPVLPPERDPDRRAAAARAAAKTFLAWCSTSAKLVSREQQPASRSGSAGGAWKRCSGTVAGQHPRAAQHGRAADDHDAGEVVDVEDLPADLRGDGARAISRAGGRRPGRRRVHAGAAATAAAPTSRGTLREFKDAAERAFLVREAARERAGTSRRRRT